MSSTKSWESKGKGLRSVIDYFTVKKALRTYIYDREFQDRVFSVDTLSNSF